MISTRIVRLIGWVGAAFFVAFGTWAFFGPKSFFDEIAVFPPYNEHFLHDVGAFQIGIGTTLALGLLGWNGLTTALGGAAVGSIFHVLAHLVDKDLGGKDSTTVVLAVLTAALTWAAGQSLPRRGRS